MMNERINAVEAEQPLQALRPNRLARRIEAAKLKRVNKPTCACCAAAKDEDPPESPARK